MNRTDLVRAISNKDDLDEQIVGRVLDSFLEVVKMSLSIGEEVSLRGFGRFETKTMTSTRATSSERRRAFHPPFSSVLRIAFAVPLFPLVSLCFPLSPLISLASPFPYTIFCRIFALAKSIAVTTITIMATTVPAL